MKAIIDLDPGMGIPWAPIDDNLALLLGLLSNELDVELVTVVGGNVTPVEGGYSLKKTIELAGVSPTSPRYSIGSMLPLSKPLHSLKELNSQKASQNQIELDFEGLIGNEDRTIENRHGVCDLMEKIEGTDEDLKLIALGPLTNIALAFRQRPDLAKKIDRLIIMGGALEVPGNITPFAEFNFWIDPQAAHQIFSLPVERVLFSLDVTNQVAFRPGELINGLSNSSGKLSEFIKESIKGRRESLRLLHDANIIHLHDVIAIAYLIDPSIFNLKELSVNCSPITGEIKPGVNRNGKTLVCEGVNKNRLKQLVYDDLFSKIASI
ncbi:nucleoside hydrolase [Candidatus Bipolaricaulota bacterium]|nr:nucleoside hydrolase [Candidatus Bipolaricaulota bacterium]